MEYLIDNYVYVNFKFKIVIVVGFVGFYEKFFNWICVFDRMLVKYIYDYG